MQEGTNIKDIKKNNRMLLLRLIALNPPVSRAELSRLSGLTKMAVGNQVKELIGQQWVEEIPVGGDRGSVAGRPSTKLRISDSSPCVCGMLIRRWYCQIVLADISGRIFQRRTYHDGASFDADALLSTLVRGYRELAAATERPVMAVGISSIGPVNATEGVILNPPDYHGIANVPIVEALRRETGLPPFLINDASAGALAERLYGRCRTRDHFVYLHIMNGIGAGLVIDGKLYTGQTGQSGGIGHTSINFSGPRCGCGNSGCLDLYASLGYMREHIRHLAPLYPDSPLGVGNGRNGSGGGGTTGKAVGGAGRANSGENGGNDGENGSGAVGAVGGEPDWYDILDAANEGDCLAVSALERFCGYIASALINILNLLDVTCLVVGYDSRGDGDIIERLLYQKIAGAVISSGYRDIEIEHSHFGGDAPLVGSIAHVANRFFNMTFVPDADSD